MNKGVTYPQGYRAAGVACGLKKDGGLDLALVVSDVPAQAAGVFTRNVVTGHSLQVAREHVRGGIAQGVWINSGCANACVGPDGNADALAVSGVLAEKLGCPVGHILPASTGVIGQALPVGKVKAGIAAGYAALSCDATTAAQAIMTTDTYAKEAQTEIMIGGKPVRIGGMAKGSGMIHPNMATLIVTLTTDADAEAYVLRAALADAVGTTLNRISIDGDTSVCDTTVLLANGLAGNPSVSKRTPEYDVFVAGLREVCGQLARMLAADGEGATKLLTIHVKNAPTSHDARLIASAIAKSPLCKTMAFGNDANWGRIFTAAGYSGAGFNPGKVDIYIGDVKVCEGGSALPFDEAKAFETLKNKEVVYTLDMNQGTGEDTVWTCDLSYDYVKINGSYRS